MKTLHTLLIFCLIALLGKVHAGGEDLARSADELEDVLAGQLQMLEEPAKTASSAGKDSVRATAAAEDLRTC